MNKADILDEAARARIERAGVEAMRAELNKVVAETIQAARDAVVRFVREKGEGPKETK